MLLEQLTWTEAREELQRLPVILPVAAACKEHGPHLPLNTDLLICDEILRRTSSETEVLVTPTIGFGYYPAFEKFPGSLSIGIATFVDTVFAILMQLTTARAKQIVVFNAGFSTTAGLIQAIDNVYSQSGVAVGLVNLKTLYSQAKSELAIESGLAHADFMETSMVLAIDPSVVRIDQIDAAGRAFGSTKPSVLTTALPLDPDDDQSPAYSPSGVLGDPRGAHRDIGNEVLSAIVRGLLAAVRGVPEPHPD